MDENRIRYQLGEGSAWCDPTDGVLVKIEHPRHPGMNFLLTEREKEWHNSPLFWGKGFVITDQGAGRWDHPRSFVTQEQGYELDFQPIPGLNLKIVRQFGRECTETYRLFNCSSESIRIQSWALSTPFRDIYPSARECLESACHAHIWTGGASSYVWALRMNGEGPGLGLAVARGALWSYSLETRNQFTSSNVRGHIFLHVTDAARSPQAMGGQPELKLASGEQYELAWTLGWYESFETFQSEKGLRPFVLSTLAAPVGGTIEIQSATAAPLEVRVEGLTEETSLSPHVSRISSNQAGLAHLDIRSGEQKNRAAVLFYRPLREIVERRVAYILANHLAVEREPDRRGAFLPVDTRSRLRIQGGNWHDWSDARERIAMPVLLQYAHRRGWGHQPAIEQALEDFNRYARIHLLDEQGTVFEDSFHRDPRRLYNFPWLAWFYWNQFRLGGRKEDLLLSALIVNRYYLLGGSKFLAFWGEWVEGLVDSLNEAGEIGTALEIQARFLEHTDYFLKLGWDLPKHEVNYEQTVVAPLVLLMELAYRWNPTPELAVALSERLRWLLAFGGRQPHVRLNHIPIRHWDGYWFGAYRQWGDIFPHYWSVQTAAALLLWPDGLEPAPAAAERQAMADTIFKANLAHFHDDGSATCAFIFPSCVDGNLAYHEDPMANDQDWALVYALHFLERGLTLHLTIE